MAIPFHVPPSGRVTLVVADVRFGALLNERDAHSMAVATELLEDYFRRVLSEHGGHEVRSEGYAFLTAWNSTVEAVRWCLRVQVGLLDLDWPEALLQQPEAGIVRGEDGVLLHRGLRVRMGVHVGSPLVRQDRHLRHMKYYGPPVSHVARIAGAAVGGQILLSSAAYAEVAGQLDDEAVTQRLGSFRLRGRRGTVELIQVSPRSLASREFAPLRTVDVRRTNLMPDRERFVGRGNDIASLHELFALGVRLVTVCGPSGMGKSRLVDRFCLDALEDWRERGGVWTCDVSGASTLDGLLRAISGSLDLPLTLGRTSDECVQQIGFAVAARSPVLIALDGVDGVAHWADRSLLSWLRAAPEARWIVSSRRPLNIPGEVVYELGPLSLPEEGDAETLRLFREIAQEIRPGWRLMGNDVGPVHELVRAVGGTPLGIRLVASQINKHSPNEMLGGIAQRAQDYSPGRVSSYEDGLIAATEFAWDQLAFWERDAIAQCAVFRGGFDLEAAEAVLDLSEHMSAPWVGDVLHVLVDRAILRRVESAEAPGIPRYTLHARVAEHARRRLPDSQKEAAEARHAHHYLRQGVAWSHMAAQRGGGEAMARLSLELDNLLAVHERALSRKPLMADDLDKALEVARAVEPLLAAWGPQSTLLRVLDTSIHAAATVYNGDVELRVSALVARARAHRHQSRLEDALADTDQGLTLLDEGITDRQACRLLTVRGDILRILGRLSEAAETLERAAEFGRREEEPRTEGLVLGAQADLAMASGNIQRALALYRDAVGRLRKVGDARNEGIYTGRLALLYRRIGQLQRSGELFHDALLAHRQTGNRWMEGVVVGHLGTMAYHRGDIELAQQRYDVAEAIAREVGDRVSEARMVAGRAIALVELGDLVRARAQVESAAQLYQEVADPRGIVWVIALRGFVEHFAGRRSTAQGAYERARELLDSQPDPRFLGSLLGWHGALCVEAGDLDGARERFDQASQLLTAAGDERLLRTLSILRLCPAVVEGQPASKVRTTLAAMVREGDAVGDVRLAAQRVVELLERRKHATIPPVEAT